MTRDPEPPLEKTGSCAMLEDLSLDPQIRMKHQTGLAQTKLYPVLVRVRTEIERSQSSQKTTNSRSGEGLSQGSKV